MKKFAFLILTLLTPFVVMAHAGHGVWHGNLLHYVGSLWHLLPVLMFAALVVYLVRHLISSRKKV